MSEIIHAATRRFAKEAYTDSRLEDNYVELEVYNMLLEFENNGIFDQLHESASGVFRVELNIIEESNG